jgi:hypothetical protein
MPPVQRSSRMIDFASIALLLLGGAIWGVAWLGLEDLRTRPPEEFVRHQTVAFVRTTEHAKLTRISVLGLSVAGLGVIVGVSAAAHARLLARRGANDMHP